MFEAVLEAVKAYDTIIIHRHFRPDGDAMGSQIGMKALLQENFPDKTVYAVGDGAGYLSFMEGAQMDEIPDSAYEGALAMVLDCGGPNMVCDDRYTKAAQTVRMDHHIYSGQFCDIEVIDSTYESCCGLIAQFAVEQGLKLNTLAAKTVRIDHHIYTGSFCDIEVYDATYESCCGLVAQFAVECGLTINKLAAKSLFTGMVTDSGRFRYDCTTVRTLRLAAVLMDQGIDLNEIFPDLYAETYEDKKRKAQFLLKVQFTPNGVAYIYTTADEIKELGISTFTASRGMVNVMGDMKGISIWVNFTESDEGVLCELRSADRAVQPIAVKYGGGGHAKACGATVPDRETAMKMLADLDQLVGGKA